MVKLFLMEKIFFHVWIGKTFVDVSRYVPDLINGEYQRMKRVISCAMPSSSLKFSTAIRYSTSAFWPLGGSIFCTFSWLALNNALELMLVNVSLTRIRNVWCSWTLSIWRRTPKCPKKAIMFTEWCWLILICWNPQTTGTSYSFPVVFIWCLFPLRCFLIGYTSHWPFSKHRFGTVVVVPLDISRPSCVPVVEVHDGYKNEEPVDVPVYLSH